MVIISAYSRSDKSVSFWSFRRGRNTIAIWKHWKKPKTRIQALRKLGVADLQAYEWENTRLGYWQIARSPILSCQRRNKNDGNAGQDLTQTPL
jgi:RNA-directed DNA polymerase